MDEILGKLKEGKDEVDKLASWLLFNVSIDKIVANALLEIARALNLQTESHLKLEEERKKMYSSIPISAYQPPDFEKLLMEAVEKRDKIREQIEEIERTVDGVPSEMRGFLLATARAPLEGMLGEQEKYISSLQEELEKKEE